MAEKRKDSKGRNLRNGEDTMPDGRYRYRYTDENGERRAVYSWRLVPTDKAPAGKRQGVSLREKEKEIEANIADGIDSRAAASKTLNDMFETYIAGKVELKESTRVNYLYMYHHFVADTIGKKKIAYIKYSDVKNFYNSLILGKGFKTDTVDNVHSLLHPVFTLAVRDGYIRSNPSDGVMAEVKKSHAGGSTKRHALTIEEQTAFLEHVKQTKIYRHWLPLFTFFFGTGCRVGEVIGLRWKDIDFKGGTISINHNMIYRPDQEGKCCMHITTPKTAAGCRIIPMLSEVREALKEERQRQIAEGFCTVEVDGYSGFIFSNRFNNPYKPVTINNAIERIRCTYNKKETARAKKENRKPSLIRHFSVHNIRHTFCTRFCENESNIKIIQEIMGHSDITTTMDIYAEATESKKKESFNNLEGKIKIS